MYQYQIKTTLTNLRKAKKELRHLFTKDELLDSVIHDIQEDTYRLLDDKLMVSNVNPRTLEERQTLTVLRLKKTVEQVIEAQTNQNQPNEILRNKCIHLFSFYDNQAIVFKSSTISVEKTDTGFIVKIPYAIKDDFKDSFKTAKWHADKKAWELGSRVEKRLMTWANEYSELADKTMEYNQQHDEIEFSQQELERLKENTLQKLADIQQQLAKLKLKNAQLQQTKTAIQELELQLKQATLELQKENCIHSQQQADIASVVSGLININAVLKAHQTLCHVYKKVGAQAREQYDDAQTIIKTAIKNLNKAGLRSKGLEKLYEMNFNRPDRDDPSTVTLTDIYNITKAVAD